MKKATPFSELQIKTELAQSKQTASLGYALKYGRQKRRISGKKMAGLLKISETAIEELESGETRKFPLGLITAYLNKLGCVLTFKIEEQPKSILPTGR
ncbi:MAG: helix-turn-helix transcriptional regulator [Candidatus Omnitrophota bacterium]